MLGEWWAGRIEVQASSPLLLSRSHRSSPSGAALLQSLVLYLLGGEVRVEKKEMVWIGVEGAIEQIADGV